MYHQATIMKELIKRKSDKCELNASLFIEQYKRKFADYLNSKVAGFTPMQNKVLLLAVCVAFLSASFYLFIKLI